MPIIKDVYWYNLNDYDYVEFEDFEDAELGYALCLQMIYEQPRWFLDNLDYVKEFQVPWLKYYSKEYCAEHKRHYATSYPYLGDFEEGL